MATFLDGRPTPGVNVDDLDIAAGVEFAATLGYGSAEHRMVVEYALQRWARGPRVARLPN